MSDKNSAFIIKALIDIWKCRRHRPGMNAPLVSLKRIVAGELCGAVALKLLQQKIRYLETSLRHLSPDSLFKG